MRQVFESLFHIALSHGYYHDGEGKYLRLEPDAVSEGLIRQNGFYWRANKNGYFLACGREFPNPPAAAYQNTAIPLQFWLSNTNSNFFNITEIPFLQIPGEILYFSNKADTPDDQPAPLSKAATAGSADILPVHGNDFEYLSPTGRIVALLDSRNRVLMTRTDDTLEDKIFECWKPVEDPGKPGRFRINPGIRKFGNRSSLAPGKYGLDTGQEPIYWFYYSSGNIPTGTLGIVEIFIGKEWKNLAPPVQGEPYQQTPEKQYKIAFNARKTKWRYFLINRNNIAFEGIAFKDNKAPSDFTKEAEKPVGGTDQQAIPVYFNTPFPLSERPLLKPVLLLPQKAGNGSDEQLTIDLPTPDGMRITPEGKNDEQQVFSDMYIYL